MNENEMYIILKCAHDENKRKYNEKCNKMSRFENFQATQ